MNPPFLQKEIYFEFQTIKSSSKWSIGIFNERESILDIFDELKIMTKLFLKWDYNENIVKVLKRINLIIYLTVLGIWQC